VWPECEEREKVDPDVERLVSALEMLTLSTSEVARRAYELYEAVLQARGRDGN
jgi:hypothetical protein